jgi:hypothetical protein
MFGDPSPICIENFGAQTNKANQIQTVDMYGDNVKTAAGVPHACAPGNCQCGRKLF